MNALQFLDVIVMKDPSQKAHFYRNTLKDALPFIPRVSICIKASPKRVEQKAYEFLVMLNSPNSEPKTHFTQVKLWGGNLGLAFWRCCFYRKEISLVMFLHFIQRRRKLFDSGNDFCLLERHVNSFMTKASRYFFRFSYVSKRFSLWWVSSDFSKHDASYVTSLR